MKVIQTSTTDLDFLKLERLLDAELLQEYPSEMGQYAPFNKFRVPIKTILIKEHTSPVACGAFKEFEDYIEIKRMFVHPDYRGLGHSRTLLNELEKWAKSLDYQYAVLETGHKLIKAIRLYQSAGYQRIPNYGPYVGLPTSICMKKAL